MHRASGRACDIRFRVWRRGAGGADEKSGGPGRWRVGGGGHPARDQEGSGVWGAPMSTCISSSSVHCSLLTAVHCGAKSVFLRSWGRGPFACSGRCRALSQDKSATSARFRNRFRRLTVAHLMAKALRVRGPAPPPSCVAMPPPPHARGHCEDRGQLSVSLPHYPSPSASTEPVLADPPFPRIRVVGLVWEARQAGLSPTGEDWGEGQASVWGRSCHRVGCQRLIIRCD